VLQARLNHLSGLCFWQYEISKTTPSLRIVGETETVRVRLSYHRRDSEQQTAKLQLPGPNPYVKT